jgi:hypothetical protein
MDSNMIQQECYKELLTCALAAGKLMQSEKTGFVHYYPNEEELGHSQTIPVVENVLFALALFRTHSIENVQEGKIILKKVLCFQIGDDREGGGNFPVFLHEYPNGRDPATALYLLAPFYWILKLYGHVIGAELKLLIEQAVVKIFDFVSVHHMSHHYPYFLAVRLASAQYAFGNLWNEPKKVQAGKSCLEGLQRDLLDGWSSTAQLGDLLAGLYMVYPSLAESPWNALWSFMEKTWHPLTGAFIGPCVREWQRGNEPKPNLYDLFACTFSGSFPKRTLVPRPFHLQGVLIPPPTERFAQADKTEIVHGEYRKQKWTLMTSAQWALTAVEKKEIIDPAVEKTFTPFSIFWGNKEAVHTFVCQGGRYTEVDYSIEGNRLDFLFTLHPDPDVEDRERRKEIEFFTDISAECQFTVDGRSSTTFEIEKPLKIICGPLCLSFVFNLVEGEGDFLGHLMQGNRPSQTLNKGEKRFNAYDWTYFLRTIRRSHRCKLKGEITFEQV